jgi:hypothetical protein
MKYPTNIQNAVENPRIFHIAYSLHRPHRWETDSMCDYYTATRSGPGTSRVLIIL